MDIEQETARQMLRAQEDIIQFASQVRTHDPHDPRQKIKYMPVNKEYIRRVLRLMVDHDRLAIYKSRQMLVTWCASVVCLREFLFIPGYTQAFISKREEDAGKIVMRCKLIYDYLPAHWKEYLPEPDTYRGKKGIIIKMVLHHPNGPDSSIQAFPQGGDALRMEVFSRAYWDEVGFCDDADARVTYGALAPTLDGGGKLLMTSTPPRDAEHFWYQLVNGTYLAGDK
jgi:hypothetical protein